MERLVLLKIKKLLSLAQSKNEHEAALAAQKAQELMDEYKLSMGDLDEITLNKEDAVGEDWLKESIGQFSYSTWKGILIHGVCKVNNVLALKYDGGARLKLIGRESDRQVAEYMACYLVREVERLAFESYASAGFMNLKHRKSWVNSFGLSAASEIVQRMREERINKQAANNSMTAIIKRDAQAVKDYLKRENIHVRYTKSNSSIRHTEAAAQGRQAGRNIQWRDGVRAGNRQKVIG